MKSATAGLLPDGNTSEAGLPGPWLCRSASQPATAGAGCARSAWLPHNDYHSDTHSIEGGCEQTFHRGFLEYGARVSAKNGHQHASCIIHPRTTRSGRRIDEYHKVLNSRGHPQLVKHFETDGYYNTESMLLPCVLHNLWSFLVIFPRPILSNSVSNAFRTLPLRCYHIFLDQTVCFPSPRL